MNSQSEATRPSKMDEPNAEQPAPEGTSPSPGQARRRLPRWKIWLFRSILVFAAPLVFLLLLEGGLILAGYGHPTSFYVSGEHGGESVYLSNQFFMRRYFGPGTARECAPFRLAQKKPGDSIRIFLLGASAAQGDPDPAYGMGRQLEVMLRERFPEQKIDVINVAITAINSHVVLPILRACAELEPDLFIVYLGNNEVVGPHGAGSVFSPLVKYRWLISLQARLKGTRLGQWLRMNIRWGGGHPGVWKGMEMFLNDPVRASDPRMEVVYAHFRENLAEMARTAQHREVPLIVSTVAVNLDESAPFASAHREAIGEAELNEWNSIYSKAVEYYESSDYAESIEHLLAAHGIDNQYAESHYRLAKCYAAQEVFAGAKEHYIRARDLDALRFRADSRINAIIRGVADKFREGGVYFVDGEKAIDSRSPRNIPGNELFYEHVHFNFEGNHAMAEALLEQALLALENRFELISEPDEGVEIAEMKRRLAYTTWDKLKIDRFNLNRLEKPPFAYQFDATDQQNRLKNRIDRHSLEILRSGFGPIISAYEEAMNEERSWFLIEHLADFHFTATGDLAEAEKYYQQVVDEFPHYTITYDALADVKLALGKYEESEALFRASFEAEPTVAQKKANLGVVIGYQGRYDEAIGLLREAAADKEYCESAYFNLAVYLFKQDPDNPANQLEAIRNCRVVIENNPEHIEARFGLAKVYLQRGNSALATEELQALLEIDPTHQPARNLLRSL